MVEKTMIEKFKKNFQMKKNGVSPVIATVLLISMVIIIGIIVFLFFREVMEESITKFEKNIELSCEEVVFDSDYLGGKLYITNDGNVPIYDLTIKFEGGGSHSTKILSAESDWKIKLGDGGLKQVGIFSYKFEDADIIEEFNEADKLKLTPILLGNTENGDNKEFVCDEQYGIEIVL